MSLYIAIEVRDRAYDHLHDAPQDFWDNLRQELEAAFRTAESVPWWQRWLGPVRLSVTFR